MARTIATANAHTGMTPHNFFRIKYLLSFLSFPAFSPPFLRKPA
jgi:hypothetical protein